ncbi:hypothetical protein A3742_25975, partial [Oleiphilus sp. HI0071]
FFGLVTVSASAEIYKWTDKDGRTHYSDKKPNAQKDAKKIKVHTGKGSIGNSSNKPSSEPQPNTPEKEQALRKKAEDLSKKQGQQASKERCDAVRENVAKMTEGARLRINENGQMRFLSPEEIADKRKTYQAFLDENCSS